MTRLKGWRGRLGLAGLALAAGLAASAGAPGKAEAGGTLIWAMPAEMGLYDPHVACGWLTKNVTHMIFDGLVELDLTDAKATYAKLRPALAEKWEISDDGTVYTFHLRKDVKFHDGTPFNAEAAKWNYDRFSNDKAPHYNKQANAFLGYYARYIKSSEVVDEFTFRVTLNEPNYEWLQSGQSSCGQPEMLSPAAREKYGDEALPLHPVGTGPFVFVEREQNVKAVIERNPNYWGTPPNLDRLIVRPMQDPSTRLSALRAGEVNMVTEPPWDEIEGLVGEGFTLLTQPNVPSLWYAQFNLQNDALKDVRVRKAINMAINREELAKQIFKGTARGEMGMLAAGNFAYDPNFKPFPYDPEGAKKLLAEAGFKEGTELEFDLFDYGWGEQWEKWVQRDLKKVGINVKLNKMEWISYLGKWLQGMKNPTAMDSMGWGWSVPLWTTLVTRCDTQAPNGWNMGSYCNEKVDALFNEARKTRDEAKATELYRQANQIIMGEDAAFLPVVSYYNPILLAPNVKGFVNAQENWYDFTLVSVEDKK